MNRAFTCAALALIASAATMSAASGMSGFTPIGAAQAGSSGSKQANLKVTAEVVSNCVVTTNDVAFGTYDPIGANKTIALDASGSIVLRCTAGTVASISLDWRQNRQNNFPRMTSGSGFLGYFLFSDSNRQRLWHNATVTLPAAPDSSARSTPVFGRVPAGANVPAGSYADTVLVTVTF